MITTDKYKNSILLEKTFQTVEISSLEIDLDKIINYLLEDLGVDGIIASYAEKRKKLEKLLVELSPAYELTEKFHGLLDTLLR